MDNVPCLCFMGSKLTESLERKKLELAEDRFRCAMPGLFRRYHSMEQAKARKVREEKEMMSADSASETSSVTHSHSECGGMHGDIRAYEGEGSALMDTSNEESISAAI